MICPVWKRVISQNEFSLLRPFVGVCKPAVKVGDKVAADSVVAHCEVSAGQRLVKVSQVLGINRNQVKKHLLRNIGDRIYQGEIVARKRGFFGVGKGELRSPADGVITDIDPNGDIIIKFLPTPLKLVAGAEGTVAEVKDNAVTLKTFGTEIKGSTGVGIAREGILKVVAKPNEFIIPQKIDSSCQGRIIVGGALLERSAIEKALTLGVRGIVVGGINYRDFVSLGIQSDVGITVIVTEGFGASPMGNDIYSALTKLNDHFGFIIGQEKTLIIPQSRTGEAAVPIKEENWRELKVGDVVRLFRPDSTDLVGVVDSISETEEALPSGLIAIVAAVKFMSGEVVKSPAANLEIIN